MKILGLPGRDQATVAWLEQLLPAIGEGDHHVTLPEYRHWNTSQPPDPQYEADQLNLTGTDLVVAKSMGTMVLLELCQRTPQPKAVVLIGVPLVAYSEKQRLELKALVSGLPCLCIQQSEDFTGSYQQLVELLDGHGADLVEVAGSDHVYSDTAQLAASVNAWLN